MQFSPPLVPAILVRRYKRFLFDAVLDDGSEITGFCPNTGSMLGLTTPGARIWLSDHLGSARKYRYAFELIEVDGTVVGVHAALANRLAEEAIVGGLVEDLSSYPVLRREQRYGAKSRIDFLLSNPERPDAYVEVKNVHFTRQSGVAEFPDTVTARGARHLQELAEIAASGRRAIMLYVVQRDDCNRLRLCGDLDPGYAFAFAAAVRAGMEAYAVACRVSADQITPIRRIAVDDPALAGLEAARRYL
ncbi:DNA/RNA nuclease SfsA [Peteryoungia ipomoeae]|uniref:Sugar fermentation stimulation protein homolog n=1 Tax=Peteryoungia ipomoeae TaxID=1210932 RepID=A0A4S8PB95_9HYPH|nr:DNA/RNA nuclease SfsA [Peteryoungia ipomoeae]THV25319.1 DNA/RNA nuclease SfsA [Peteryoungia ipomoeae]